MYEIPTTINLSGETFKIRNDGDFRMVLDCFAALDDETLTKQERLLASLIIFYDGMNELEDLDRFPDIQEAVKEMYNFFNCGGQTADNSRNYKLLDWEKDSQIVCSAINKIAGKEIRFEQYLHWWTFMGYYMSIDESLLSTIVSIRYKILAHKKMEKHEKEFRRDNPQYFIWNSKSVEDKEAEAMVKELWNSGK